MPTIKIRDIAIEIPDDFQKMNSMPDDPENSEVFGYQHEETSCFMICYPIPQSAAMPFEEPSDVIAGIHSSLALDQVLVKVDNGKTAKGAQYIYSIVKSAKEPSGVVYNLTLHMEHGDDVLNINAFFEEIGMTGRRDAIVFDFAIKQGMIKGVDDGWAIDPYFPDRTEGLLMNLSESEGFDQSFEGHPLSELRAFVKFLIDNN